jgi:hypothetical protein
MKPIATDIGNCIRILRHFSMEKRRITIETAIISSIKVPLTDSLFFLISSLYHKTFEGHPSGNPFRLSHFSFTASNFISIFTVTHHHTSTSPSPFASKSPDVNPTHLNRTDILTHGNRIIILMAISSTSLMFFI